MKKLLLITGGSKGIGAATIAKFLDQGYAVANISRSPSTVGGVTQITADISNPAWLEQCGAELVDLVEPFDQITLVHSAALLRKDSVKDIGQADFAHVMQTNVLAAAQLNGLLIPKLKPGSAIIFVGSTLSEKAVANSCSYVTSKHATIGLMRATCQDLMGTGIHTACVCPGFTDTEMLQTHLGHDAEIIQSIASGNSFGRLILSEEIADTIYFCASQPVINGSVIHANLGQIEH